VAVIVVRGNVEVAVVGGVDEICVFVYCYFCGFGVLLSMRGGGFEGCWFYVVDYNGLVFGSCFFIISSSRRFMILLLIWLSVLSSSCLFLCLRCSLIIRVLRLMILW